MDKEKYFVKKIEALGGVDLENPFDELGSFVDYDLLKKTYPELTKLIDKDHSPSDLVDLIADHLGDDESILKVMNNDSLISITLQNNEKQYISFKEIVKILPDEVYPDALDFLVIMNFVIYVCEPAVNQAGAIAIWDTTKKKFIFEFSDLHFCVKELSFDSTSNEFQGKFSYDYPYSCVAGEGDFKITPDRKLKTLRYSYIDSENKSHDGIGKFFDKED